MSLESCCSFGSKIRLGFGGAYSLPSLDKMTFDDYVNGREVLGSVSIG